MTPNEYQSACREFAVYPHGNLTLENEDAYPASSQQIYCALGLANEAGEVLGVVKKTIRSFEYGKGFVREKIKAELGDVLWYAAELATAFNLTLEEVMEANLAKATDRKERGVLHGDGDNR